MLIFIIGLLSPINTIYSANNCAIQINVTGWKYIHEGNMGGAIIKMYRNKENGYIHSQSTFTSLGSGLNTFNNMFPSQMIPNITVTLPLNYASNNNKILLQSGSSTILVDVNSPTSKSTHFGVMYPLKNP